MTFEEIRTRLAGLEGRTYWRSLEELADSQDFREYVSREFPAQASEFTDPAGRRQFLKLMGASLALAGVSACTRMPDEKIVPYVKQPEEIVPGRPLFFATAMPHGGFAMPLLAENHMGRPTKLEGNPEHPASLGATDIFGQASVLSLYDPDRSRTIVNRSDVGTWSDFLSALQSAVGTRRASGGQGLRLLTEPITSPSLLDQIDKLMTAMPAAKWHQWDPVFGTVQGGAPAERALYRFDNADIVVALDADFLGGGAGSLRYSKDFASRRRIGTPQDQQNRLYMAEPVITVTGTKAEHRAAVKARDIHAVTAALAAAAGVSGAAPSPAPGETAAWVAAAAADLQAHRGKSAVVAGDHQPPAVHALARLINEALGNVGSTVTYEAPVTASAADGAVSIAELAADMYTGKVNLLVILGGNPAFTAPADVGFAGALAKMSSVGTIIHLGSYYDETAELCHWHVPEAHYLESWGDARSFDGTVTMIQPLIAPLYDGRQAIEILAVLNGAAGVSPAELIKDYWTRAFQGQTKTAWTLRDQQGTAFANKDIFWRHALHDGFLHGTSLLSADSLSSRQPQAPGAGTPPPAVAPAPRANAAPPASSLAGLAPPAMSTGMEVVFRPDPTILDGRYANNGWLQELPKPLSKVTWDNVAYIGVKTAERLGISPSGAGDPNSAGNGNRDLIEIKIQNRAVRLPVWIMPGTADDVVVVHFGYGRRKAGRVGTGLGHDTFALRTSKAPWFESGATVTKTGQTYTIAATQNHFMMEGRNPVRVVSAAEYRADPKKSVDKFGERPPKMLTLYSDYEYKDHKWGMAIDLNACTGCSVCMIACVAENNIPVVGKEQVEKTREMHWIRVDTYFEGSLDAPATYNQPVPCQQCENAPCELVCPVAATQHSDEGLNEMIYNRCVGTRYCSNNCPYKVRRFNFLLYSDFSTPELFAQRNPDVTIRSRGVMEKCTYCVQRINHARIDAKTEGRQVKDGEVVTACQQACPSDAIVFGNLNDPASRVAKVVQQDRNYGLLEDLNTRPRTTYLAVVRNVNEKLGTR